MRELPNFNDFNDPWARLSALGYAELCRKTQPDLSEAICKAVYAACPEYDEVFEYTWTHVDAVSNALESQIDKMFPLELVGCDGESVGYVIHEFDKGEPMTRDHPGEPGYSYFRLANCKEIVSLLSQEPGT